MNTLSMVSRYSGRDLKQHLSDTSHRHHHSTRFPVKSAFISMREKDKGPGDPVATPPSYDLGFCLCSHVQTCRGVHTRGTSAREEHRTRGQPRHISTCTETGYRTEHRGSILGRNMEISSKSFYFTNGCSIYPFNSTLKFTLKLRQVSLCTVYRTHTIKYLT
jgi:hypothetical protein